MKKRPRRRRRPFFLFTAVAVLLLTAFSAAVRYVDRIVAPMLAGETRSAYTTRIYSAPLRLRTGDPMSGWELRSRLDALGYRRVKNTPEEPGSYRERGYRFEIHLRSFSHPFVPPTPIRAELELRDGAVVSLGMLAGQASPLPLVEIALEPQLLYEIAGAEQVLREPLSSGEIPTAMRDALVSVEDRRFFSHWGVDPRGIARAAWRNLVRGRISEGGSTLTQQLARTLFLTSRRTMTRKIKEAMLAIYLDARFSKREILRLYLESVYFGQDGTVSLMGLPAAAKHYFDKAPPELTIAECALLAGLVRSPNRTNPYLNPQGALRRRAVVLAAMRREGKLSKTEERRLRAEPLRTSRSAKNAPRRSDYFLAYLLRNLERRYADKALFTRGLTIHTTLDPWLQDRAKDAVRRAKHQAALVALDSRTGAIRALMGGKDFLSSPFDRATRARRQPGSAFKPFVYGAALRVRPDAGRVWTPASLINDSTRSFRVEGGLWSPRNYDRRYRGPVRLRTALAKSLNAATVNLAAEIGPKAIIDYARALGILSPLRPELGLALGAFEVSLLELTGAYCAFANGGYRIEPYAVEIALDSDGMVLEYHSPEPRPVISAGESYLMTSLLRETVMSGTARSLARWGLRDVSAGKTGTTNDGKDAWFVGYTPWLIAGVWTGTDRPAKLGLSGAGAALPIWARFMRGASPLAPRRVKPPGGWWPRPEGVLTREVDPASGLLAKSGCLRRRTEIFLPGTAPEKGCPLHSGGLTGWFKRVFGKQKVAVHYR